MAHQKNAKTRRPEAGMLRIKAVQPTEMQGLLARTYTVEADQYVRSIRKDVRKWLKRYAPTAKAAGTAPLAQHQAALA